MCWGSSTPYYIPKQWIFVNILLSRHLQEAACWPNMPRYCSVFVRFSLKIGWQGDVKVIYLPSSLEMCWGVSTPMISFCRTLVDQFNASAAHILKTNYTSIRTPFTNSLVTYNYKISTYIALSTARHTLKLHLLICARVEIDRILCPKSRRVFLLGF